MKISQYFLALPLIMLSFLLTACGGSSSNNPQTTSKVELVGTAATGAAIKGFVYAKDAKGTEVNVATGVDGSFTLNATDLTPPIMLKVVPDDNSKTYYSYAESNSQTVNITPLTHLAVFLAANKANPDTLYGAWNGDNIAKTNLTAAQAKINANLRTQMTANGLDPNSYNFLTAPFTANSTGFDKVLDEIDVSVDATNSSFTVNIPAQTGFSFNEAISVAGISFDTATPSLPNTGNSTDETPATIPAEHAKQYNLTFKESAAGSGIADGTQRTFALGTDGTMVIDGTTTLNNPVFYKGNTYEAIWSDATNNLKYAFSSIRSGDSFNEINVSNNQNYDQIGFKFYGQFRDNASTQNATTCSETNGSLSLSADDSAVTDLTGTEFCPGQTAAVDANTSLITFEDAAVPTATRKGGIISLQVTPPSTNVFTTTKGFVQIQYTQNGIIHAKYANDVTFATYGVSFDQTAKTVTFTNVTLPAKNCETCKGLGLLKLNGMLKYN